MSACLPIQPTPPPSPSAALNCSYCWMSGATYLSLPAAATFPIACMCPHLIASPSTESSSVSSSVQQALVQHRYPVPDERRRHRTGGFPHDNHRPGELRLCNDDGAPGGVPDARAGHRGCGPARGHLMWSH